MLSMLPVGALAATEVDTTYVLDQTNRVPYGDFEDKKGWIVNNKGNSALTCEYVTENNKTYLQISGTYGDGSKDPQLCSSKSSYPIIKDQWYQISFRAKATSAASVAALRFRRMDHETDNLGMWSGSDTDPIPLSTQWQTYVRYIKATLSATTFRLFIDIDGSSIKDQSCKIYYDDVSVRKCDTSTPEGYLTSNYNVMADGENFRYYNGLECTEVIGDAVANGDKAQVTAEASLGESKWNVDNRSTTSGGVTSASESTLGYGVSTTSVKNDLVVDKNGKKLNVYLRDRYLTLNITQFNPINTHRYVYLSQSTSGFSLKPDEYWQLSFKAKTSGTGVQFGGAIIGSTDGSIDSVQRESQTLTTEWTDYNQYIKINDIPHTGETFKVTLVFESDGNPLGEGGTTVYLDNISLKRCMPATDSLTLGNEWRDYYSIKDNIVKPTDFFTIRPEVQPVNMGAQALSTIALTNTTAKRQSLSLIMAVYEMDGTLINTQIPEEYFIDPGESKVITKYITMPKTPGKYRVKAYVWDMTNEYKPVFASEEEIITVASTQKDKPLSYLNFELMHMMSGDYTAREYLEPFIEAGTDLDMITVTPSVYRANLWNSETDPEWNNVAPQHGIRAEVFYERAKGYIGSGGDPVMDTYEVCREYGLDFFINYRMNDQHNTSNEFYSTHNEFWADHPEWWINNKDASSSGRVLNYAEEGVRNYYLTLIKELATKYDIDGFEFDFDRHPTYFSGTEMGNDNYSIDSNGKESGSVVTNVGYMNDFVESIYNMIGELEEQRGKDIKISIRLPGSFNREKYTSPDIYDDNGKLVSRGNLYKVLGLDPMYWASNGWIDMINVSPHYNNIYTSVYIDEYRDSLSKLGLSDKIQVYGELNYLTEQRSKDVQEGVTHILKYKVKNDEDGIPAGTEKSKTYTSYSSARRYVTQEAYNTGALYVLDKNVGISYFNFRYDATPPFGALSYIDDKEELARRSQHFVFNSGSRVTYVDSSDTSTPGYMPKIISKNYKLVYDVNISDAIDFNNFKNDCIIKVETATKMADTEALTVSVKNDKGEFTATEVNWAGIRNTFKVHDTDLNKQILVYDDFADLFHRGGFRGETDYFGYTYSKKNAKFFRIDKSALTNGINTFTVTKTKGENNKQYIGFELAMYSNDDVIDPQSVMNGNVVIYDNEVIGSK